MRTIKMIIILLLCSVSALAVYIPKPPGSSYEAELKCSRLHGYVEGYDIAMEKRANHNYDVQKYTIDIHIDDVAEYIKATTTINVNIAENGSTQIEFDLAEIGLSVNECRIDGIPCEFAYANAIITINMDGIYNIGDNIDIEVDYEGSPSSGIYFDDQYDNCYTYTSPFDGNWYPSYYMPGDKADDGVELYIDVRDDWDVASNGLLIGTSEPAPGRKEYHWKHEYPISNRLIAFATMDMYFYEDTWDSIPLRIWSRSSQDDIDEIVDLYKLQLDGFKYRCGDYPFANEKVGVSNAGASGMEHQTISGIGILHEEFLSAHEQAHQWWGNCVTGETWDDIWLHEGFASYCEMFYWEDAYGMDRVKTEMENEANSVFNNNYVQTDPIYPPDPSFGHGLVYYKGSWVLHMMRHEMDSDTQFYDTLKYYRSQHEHDTATTLEFQNDVEAFTGDNWDIFFQQWVYGAGYPEVEWSWTNSGANEITIQVEQIQDTVTYPLVPIFQMHIDFGLTTTDGEEVQTVWMPDEEETFVLTTTSTVTNVEFDPNVWLLCDDLNLTAIESVTFDAHPVRNGVKLEWFTEDEYGDVSFNIYREEVSTIAKVASTKRVKINNEPIVGVSPYSLIDKTTEVDVKYNYWLEVLEPQSPMQTFGPATAEGPVLVKAFELMQNRPNPANSTTTFSFALPEAANAKLSIFDIKGRKVATVIDSDMPAGEHSLDYKCNLSSGIYVYRLDAGGETAVRKMIVK